jgi:fumarate reductase subunit D
VLQAPETGWSDPFVIALLAGALVLMALFVRIELVSPRPMLDLSLFRYGRFVGVQLLAAAPAYAFVVLLILLPIRFVGIEGIDAVAAGRMMMALSAPLLVLPLLAGWLSRWIAPAVICGLGLMISAAGLAWLSFMPAGGDVAAMLAPMAVIGLGISLPWGLMDGLAVSVVPSERAGMATGIFSTVRVAGEGVALAIVSAVLSALTASHLSGEQVREGAQKLVTGDVAGAATALPQLARSALIQGYGEAFATLLHLLAGITVITAIVVFVFLGRRETSGGDVAAKTADASSGG